MRRVQPTLENLKPFRLPWRTSRVETPVDQFGSGIFWVKKTGS
jgi:hypothetical protein